MRVFIFLIFTTIGHGQVNVDQGTTLTKISDNITIGKTNFGNKFATKIIYYHHRTTTTTTTEGKITAPYNLQPEYWHGQRFLGEIESSFAGTPQDLYICIMSSFKFFKKFTNVPDENICERETRTFAEYLKYRLISEEEKQELKSVKKRMKILTKRLMTISSIERNDSTISSRLQQKYIKKKPVLKNGEQTTKNSINSLATKKLHRVVTTLLSPAKDYFEMKLKYKNPRETITNLAKPLNTTKFHRIVPTRISPIKDFFEAKLKHKSSKHTMRNLTKPLTVTKFYKNTTISPVKQHLKEKGGIKKSGQTVKILNNSTRKFHQIKGEEENLKSARLTMKTRSKLLITAQTHRNVSTTPLKDDYFEGKPKPNETNQTITDSLISMELQVNASSKVSPDEYFETWPVIFGLSVIGIFILVWLIVLTIGLCLAKKKRSLQKNTCALTAFQTGTFRRVENV